MTELVLPEHTNNFGTIFGGQVMAWIDIAAAISAMKHARQSVVTASIDALHFIAPIRAGHIVHIKAIVNYVGKTSMEVGVRVDSEDPISGTTVHNVSAYTTFVAINSSRKPQPITPVIPETKDEKRRYEEAIARKSARMKLAKELKEERDKAQ